MKIITIIGARPQFIKSSILSKTIGKYSEINEVIIHSGQHFDSNMSEVFFEEMGIKKPKYNLKINSSQKGTTMIGRMIEKCEAILKIEKPDLVLVYGDTNTTLAGALSANNLNIPIAHVEAGLRSFNHFMPEEINRIITDKISTYLFCPTQKAVENLMKEGLSENQKIFKCGDVMQDAAFYYAEKSAIKSNVISKINLSKFILCTLHRAENTDNEIKLRSIVNSLNEIHKTTPIVLPLHPRTKLKIQELGLNLNVNIIDPVGYFDMMELLKKCALVLTDSGGLQKEAYFFKKNCVTMRDETEWVELIEKKVNIIVGSEKDKIVNGVNLMLNQKSDFTSDLYGNGNACNIIVKEISNK